MPPLITIGLTAFNSQAHILRALSSAVDQTWPEIEIIVVDDGSTDSTFELIEQFAAGHPQVRILRQLKNAGVAAARNRIVEEARGEFIAFFDDDDVSVPDRITRQYARITQYEQSFAKGAPVICHTARLQKALDGSERIEPTMGCLGGREAPNGTAVAARILWGRPLEDGYGAIATCSQMARTSTYRALAGFDPSFQRSEDTEFCVRLALSGGHFTGIDDPLVLQTLTHRSGKSLETELFYKRQLLDKHRQAFYNDAHYRFSRNWLTLKYLWLSGDRGRFVQQLLACGLAHPLLTWRRLWYALPQFNSNRSFARFHRQ